MTKDDIRHIDPNGDDDEGEKGGDDASQGDPGNRDGITKLVMRPGNKFG